MPTRKKTKRKQINNNVIIFLAIVIVLALISVVIAYFVTDKESDAAAIPNKTVQQNEKQNTSVLEGTWVSNYDGTMLTIKGQKVTFEMPSVDDRGKINGSINIEKNIVTFFQTDGPCGNEEGHYLYSIDQKKELFFKLIKDNCTSRKELMSMTWFKL
jgi:hypothetical protein